MEKVNNNLSSLENKLEHLEKNYNKDVFNNPIRENAEELRNDLLDLAKTFQEEIEQYTKENVI